MLRCRALRRPAARPPANADRKWRRGGSSGGGSYCARCRADSCGAAHILEVWLPLDREEIPAEVMQPEHGDNVRLTCHRLLKILSILVEGRLPAGNDFRDDGAAVARRSPGEDRAIAALLDLVLEVSALRDRHGGGFRPVFLLRCV